MIAVEAFKIIVAQTKLSGLDMEMHTLVYDEKLNQLKHDFAKRWLFQHDGANATDLKKYLDDFAKSHEIKPEEKSQLEDYTSTRDDFRETMTFIARKLNESGKVHIILMDEVELQCVASIKNDVDVDLSYLAEFENASDQPLMDARILRLNIPRRDQINTQNTSIIDIEIARKFMNS